MRCERPSAFSEFSIAWLNRLTYHRSEYWYIGSMFARSLMQKNIIATCSATGL